MTWTHGRSTRERGDITHLEINGIVNAANRSLLGGGGVDGCIHRAAGNSLLDECRTLGGCSTGSAKVTSGHRLPAKYILHAVGPVGEQETKLGNCYQTCLSLALEHKIRSLAFCCISTGIYGYPNRNAANVALRTVRSWLDESENANKMDQIIFCTFLPIDVRIYEELMPSYFPDDLEAARTYSSCELDTQESDTLSDDESLPSKKERKDRGSTAAVTSNDNDTDEYDNTDTHSPERHQDAQDLAKESKAESEKPIEYFLRSVSAPAAIEQSNGKESVCVEGSPQGETNMLVSSEQQKTETAGANEETVTTASGDHLTGEENPTENVNTGEEATTESLVDEHEQQEEITTACTN
ncbi:ADP-ribose glycohydrolase MACROD2-like isoform X2 [Corticium candelabrum]|uniref:ADP-ribose glycohydrolase MACROD2-like isoform X2 n=1 Tax=Corticium candelabrum TaxID=121492 RepID=UPI002E27146F|nr:ADP-ribose glycohydrolase MACROD2-like isoform X2 [Corticium candelabrum]